MRLCAITDDTKHGWIFSGQNMNTEKYVLWNAGSCSISEILRNKNCFPMQNFTEIGQSAAELCSFQCLDCVIFLPLVNLIVFLVVHVPMRPVAWHLAGDGGAAGSGSRSGVLTPYRSISSRNGG